VRFKDAAGNTSLAWDYITSATDTTPPIGSVVINNGDVSTTTMAATLTITASDAQSAVTQMRLSKDNVTWYGWEAYVPLKVIGLLPGFGTRSIYIQFKDARGNVSTIYQDEIDFVSL
jgi:hypothetical protein